VKLELTPEGERQLRSVRNVDPQAYDYYLHGRYHWARLTFPEMQKAAEYFRKATERDPGFAMAFSGLADSLMILPINSDMAPKDAFPEAKAAVTRALALGQDSAEAHNSAAAIKFWFERYVPPYNLALVFAGLGQTESAQHWLQQAFEDRDVHMAFLRDHKWDSMRGNPWFQKIVERVGLMRP
jgi:tetratricopeptide (TPR) repeat protein